MQGGRRNPLGLAHPGRVFLATALGILLVDQITKAIVRAWMPVRTTYELIPHVIQLNSLRNSGAAFSLLPGYQPLFVATSVLVLVFMAGYWFRTRPSQWPIVIALAMVSAGASGNLIDRVVVHQVTDFFEFTFVNFPVFNVADIGIVCGVGVLMFWILFGPDPGEADPAEPDADVSADDAEPDPTASSAAADSPDAASSSEPPTTPPDESE